MPGQRCRFRRSGVEGGGCRTGLIATFCHPPRLAKSPPFFGASSRLHKPPRPAWRPRNIAGVTLTVPDSLLPAVPLDAYLGEPGARCPALAERFLPPPEFVWGSFAASDGAVLRWGHLPVREARAACVIGVGFGEFIEKHFETMRD